MEKSILAHVEIALLGPVELVDGGARVEITSRRQRQLLIALALQRGLVISVDRICDLVWGEQLPSDPGAAVQTNISRLRRVLRAPLEVTTSPTGYQLVCPDEGSDLARFEHAITAMRTASPSEQVVLAAGALDLWRGTPFPDLDHPDIEAERQRVSELRLETVETYAEALCLLGRHGEAVAIAENHVREHPHRERSAATLMRSLYATGRQADALEVFGRLRRRLLDDLGVDPSQELRLLELAILNQEPDIAPTPAAPVLPAATVAAPVGSSVRDLDQHIRFCRSDDGTRIAYATSGDGPTLVKSANWMTHLDYDWESPVWRHWLGDLSEGHTLVRYDERGCGLSDWDVDRFTFDAWVDDLALVVDALELDRFPLLGVSQGGAVAIAYAVRHPERVSRLVLFGAYGQGRLVRATTEEQRREAALHLELARLGWGSDDPAFRQVFTSQFMPGGTREQWESFNELQRRTTSSENAVRFMEVFATIDVMDLAPLVQCPTLILHSRSEVRVPISMARELAALIPGSRLVPLPSRNHILGEDEPAWDLFLDEINRFLTAEALAPL